MDKNNKVWCCIKHFPDGVPSELDKNRGSCDAVAVISEIRDGDDIYNSLESFDGSTEAEISLDDLWEMWVFFARYMCMQPAGSLDDAKQSLCRVVVSCRDGEAAILEDLGPLENIGDGSLN